MSLSKKASSFDADLTEILQRDAALNPNLFYYNKKVLNYYLEMPRIISHHQTQKYRRTR